MNQKRNKINMASRFRGLLPVVVDLETTGVNPATDGLLEIAAVALKLNDDGVLYPDQSYAYHIEPFVGANIDPRSLEITGIDPDATLRFAITEKQALHNIFRRVRKLVEAESCNRAVLVGHNAWFDLAFMHAAVKRCHLQNNNPFHSFTTFDTATLAAVGLGETVLARAARAAKIPFDVNMAHSALYDAERTAELFCYLVNQVSFFS